MANCHVLEADQKLTDRPSKRIKRSGGHSLVRQLKADWIIENVLLKMRSQAAIQMHANSSMAGRNYTPNSDRRYIPEKLPANIDYKLGLTVQAPILANQVRFRPIADQRSQICSGQVPENAA